MNNALADVNFDIIRYANCWEDAGVLLHALKGGAAQRIAIIASAGDNALALLANSPESVLAFDISLPQLYLSELKQVAFSRLEYEELLQLLGIDRKLPVKSVQLFDHISVYLSSAARAYWEERKDLIAKWLIHSGKFERYFALFRKYCLPLVQSRKMIAELLRPKSDEEQHAFYHQHWSNPGWRLLMSVFFSKAVMGRAGRDPQFLKQVRLSVSKYIRQKAEAHLQSSEATRNPLLHYIFTGDFGMQLPHYLRRESFDVIQRNIGRLTLYHGSADEVVAMQMHDTYCLSNIFEYFPQEQFNATVNKWSDLLPTGALLLFWNLMVPRSFSEIAPDAFTHFRPGGHVTDAGFFYSAFLSEQRR